MQKIYLVYYEQSFVYAAYSLKKDADKRALEEGEGCGVEECELDPPQLAKGNDS